MHAPSVRVPRRDDAADAIAVRVDHHQHVTLDLADRPHPDLAVGAALVHRFDRAAQEHSGREGEPETALGLVLRALAGIELDVHPPKHTLGGHKSQAKMLDWPSWPVYGS